MCMANETFSNFTWIINIPLLSSARWVLWIFLCFCWINCVWFMCVCVCVFRCSNVFFFYYYRKQFRERYQNTEACDTHFYCLNFFEIHFSFYIMIEHRFWILSEIFTSQCYFRIIWSEASIIYFNCAHRKFQRPNQIFN